MFDGRLLNGVSVLAAVVESGSFARANEALGLTASGVSRAVARLESRIGVRLLDLTTRSLRLTDDRARFYEQVVPLLGGIEEAAAMPRERRRRCAGGCGSRSIPFLAADPCPEARHLSRPPPRPAD